MTEFKAREVFAGLMSYGFTWLLMPLKVGIFTPKSKWKNRQYST